MKSIIGAILIILSIPALLYVSLWWGLVEPIITVVTAIDNGTATATLIGWEVIKFLCREVLAVFIFYIMLLGGIGLMKS